MKFLRILPEMCARTWCLFSNSTLNIALGSGSTTVAITSIASSLGIPLRPYRRGGGRPARLEQPPEAEDDRPFRLDRHGVLEVRRGAAVPGPHRPAVAPDDDLGPTDVRHRLDGDYHTRLQHAAPSRRTVIGHLGLLVESRSDAVPDKVP